MDGAKKVVVIGTGIGGAGVAALLAAKGHEVTLLEKNAFIGGKCSTFEKDGFIVDTGVHMYSMGGFGPHGDIARMSGGRQEWLYKNPQCDIYANGDVLWRTYQVSVDSSARAGFTPSVPLPLVALQRRGRRSRPVLESGNSSSAKRIAPPRSTA